MISSFAIRQRKSFCDKINEITQQMIVNKGFASFIYLCKFEAAAKNGNDNHFIYIFDPLELKLINLSSMGR
jgi:hypothetical protein